MALAKDTPRNYKRRGLEAGPPVQASSEIFAGSACSTDTGGEVGPLATGEVSFAGFSIQGTDNSAGSAGDIDARLLTEGLIELTVTGLDDNDDLNDVVYASDDGTFTLVASGSMAIGRVYEIVSLTDNKCIVLFKGAVHEHQLD